MSAAPPGPRMGRIRRTALCVTLTPRRARAGRLDATGPDQRTPNPTGRVERSGPQLRDIQLPLAHIGIENCHCHVRRETAPAVHNRVIYHSQPGLPAMHCVRWSTAIQARPSEIRSRLIGPGCVSRAPVASRPPGARRLIRSRGSRRRDGVVRPSIVQRIGQRTTPGARAGFILLRKVWSGRVRPIPPRGSPAAGRNRHAPQTTAHDPASQHDASPARSGCARTSPLCTYRPANVPEEEVRCSWIGKYGQHADPKHPNTIVSIAAPDLRTDDTRAGPAPAETSPAPPQAAYDATAISPSSAALASSGCRGTTRTL